MVLNYSIIEGYSLETPDTTDIVSNIEKVTDKLATHVLSENDLKNLNGNIESKRKKN